MRASRSRRLSQQRPYPAHECALAPAVIACAAPDPSLDDTLAADLAAAGFTGRFQICRWDPHEPIRRKALERLNDSPKKRPADGRAPTKSK